MSHTKEPWHVAPGGDYCDIVCQDHVDIARTYIEEDARRIVACVNACIGLETEMLLALVRDGTTLQNIMGRGLICLEQRDELLASVEKALLWNKSRKYIMPYRIRDPLLAAVISAKGGA